MKDELIRNVKNDRFAKLIGIKLVEVREGFAVTDIFWVDISMSDEFKYFI
jgi:hypothetical protein